MPCITAGVPFCKDSAEAEAAEMLQELLMKDRPRGWQTRRLVRFFCR